MISFRQDLEQEPIRNLPLRDAIVVSPYTLIRAAVAVMRDRSLGCAVIVEHGLFPVGLFTEQSLLKVLAQNASLDERPVRAFADPNFMAFSANDPISKVWDAIQAMHGSGVSSLLVVDHGRLVGIFTERDVLERVAERYERVASDPVETVMTADPTVVYESDPTAAAVAGIAVAGHRHVPVLGVDGTVKGIVSPLRVISFLSKRFSIPASSPR